MSWPTFVCFLFVTVVCTLMGPFAPKCNGPLKMAFRTSPTRGFCVLLQRFHRQALIFLSTLELPVNIVSELILSSCVVMWLGLWPLVLCNRDDVLFSVAGVVCTSRRSSVEYRNCTCGWILSLISRSGNEETCCNHCAFFRACDVRH